jgi:hypothetical protein
MKISVIGLWRNSLSHIHNTLTTLNNLCELGSFDFYFYENDSTDQTKDILDDWIKIKSGFLLTENIGSPQFGSVPNIERLVLLSYYRNKAKQLIKNSNSKYTLLIDTDIIFNNKNLLDLYNFMEANDNCCMSVANTRQYQIEDLMESKTTDSFYDVFALRDSLNNNGLYFTDCPLILSSDRELWKKNLAIKIMSGFGGFSLIRTEILRQEEVIWSTCGHSEHVNFCYTLAKYGDIYLLPYCKPKTEIVLSSINMDACKQIAQKQKQYLESINYLHDLSISKNIKINK